MRHGTYVGYNHHHCRCPACSAAYYRQQKVYRLASERGLDPKRHLVDGTGTRRRIQALGAMGWSCAALAPYLGYASKAGAKELARRPMVRRESAARVAEVYDQLSMTPGPSRRARVNAKRYGWPPPLAWDDDTIDDPTATPDFGEHAEGVGQEDTVWMVTTGGVRNWINLEERTGNKRSSLRTALRRAGRHDLIEMLDITTYGDARKGRAAA